jgi:hypothetical protein
MASTLAEPDASRHRRIGASTWAVEHGWRKIKVDRLMVAGVPNSGTLISRRVLRQVVVLGAGAICR